MDKFNLTEDYEKHYFADTLDIVRSRRDNLDADVSKKEREIEDMWDQYFAGDVEIRTTLDTTIALCKQEKKELARYRRASNKPYFGRIIFTDKENKTRESLYIGRCGVTKNLTEQVVADWRAPISNIYYENGLGDCAICSPEGEMIELSLELKRTYDIDEGKLSGFMDSEVVANDELLTKYLARNKQAVLGEIIATIQKEQNDIIRRNPFRNVLVQGAAGSGKTTVAMHRISYILYNYADKITPEHFFIIGSNRMLLNYITGVLPELDVEGVKQMTLEELFVSILADEWDDDKYSVSHKALGAESVEIGGTKRFMALKAYLDEYEKKALVSEDVILRRYCFVEGVKDGKTGVYDRSKDHGDEKDVKLIDQNVIERMRTENGQLSLQQKILNLNEILTDSLEYELVAHTATYTEKEKTAIRKNFKDYFGKPEYPVSAFEIYEDFLRSIGGNSKPEKIFNVYELAQLAYIYSRIINTSVSKIRHHMIIDEAQDYGMMAYRALDYIFQDCTYTVMGDVSQNIRFESGINNWDELKGLLMKQPGDAFCTLRKSYRNTVETSEFATKILDHGDFDVYPVEPIIRHGDEPAVIEVTESEVADSVREICRSWQEDGHGTIAIVTADYEEAAAVHKKLTAAGLELLENDYEKAEFGNGIMVLPVALTKGLEFDAVLLYEPTADKYPVNDKNAKLLYVAATRALHELCVICSGKLTGLIADEVPEDKKRRVIDADPVSEDTLTPGQKQLQEMKAQKADEEYVKNLTLSGALERTEKKAWNPAAQKIPSAADAEGWRSSDGVIRDTRFNIAMGGNGGAKGTTVTAGGLGSLCEEDFLKTYGHASPALSAKWVTKQNTGVFIQSRYGILRVCPISPSVVRVSFCAGSMFKLPEEGIAKTFSMVMGVQIKETPKDVTVTAANVIVSVDKQTGAVTFKDGKGRELMKEPNLEPYVITSDKNQFKSVVSFAPKKSNTYHALAADGVSLKYVGDRAMFISSDGASLPMVLVKDSFAVVAVTKHKTAFNNLPGQGTKLVSESSAIDFYFMVGSTDEMLGYYKKL